MILYPSGASPPSHHVTHLAIAYLPSLLCTKNDAYAPNRGTLCFLLSLTGWGLYPTHSYVTYFIILISFPCSTLSQRYLIYKHIHTYILVQMHICVFISIVPFSTHYHVSSMDLFFSFLSSLLSYSLESFLAHSKHSMNMYRMDE